MPTVVYGYFAALTVAPGAPRGELSLLVSARDQAGHIASLALGAFDVLGAPGGSIPAGLPQRLGWGTNQWSETPGQDWQVNSGVPWDYVYQYITYEWYSDPGHWGGDFVGRFVRQAWGKGYVPVISAYLILGTPPACGEAPSCYAQKLQNAGAVTSYLAALQMAANEAKGAKPVIFQIDPDFYGYMQQYKYSSGKPSPDDPSSYPVALNVPGYANTLAGFGQRVHEILRVTVADDEQPPSWIGGVPRRALPCVEPRDDVRRAFEFTGEQRAMKTADLNSLFGVPGLSKWTRLSPSSASDLGSHDRRHTYRLEAAGSDPLVSLAWLRPIRYRGELVVTLRRDARTIEVIFRGDATRFPSFEGFAQHGGQTAVLFRVAPQAGSDVSDLLLGTQAGRLHGEARLPLQGARCAVTI